MRVDNGVYAPPRARAHAQFQRRYDPGTGRPMPRRPPGADRCSVLGAPYSRVPFDQRFRGWRTPRRGSIGDRHRRTPFGLRDFRILTPAASASSSGRHTMSFFVDVHLHPSSPTVLLVRTTSELSEIVFSSRIKTPD